MLASLHDQAGSESDLIAAAETLVVLEKAEVIHTVLKASAESTGGTHRAKEHSPSSLAYLLGVIETIDSEREKVIWQ